jgi:hypothetical protein
VNKIQEFVGDFCNRYIVNIQLISFNKEKKKVKRTFKLGKLYLVRRVIQICWLLAGKNKILLQNNGTLPDY